MNNDHCDLESSSKVGDGKREKKEAYRSNVPERSITGVKVRKQWSLFVDLCLLAGSF